MPRPPPGNTGDENRAAHSARDNDSHTRRRGNRAGTLAERNRGPPRRLARRATQPQLRTGDAASYSGSSAAGARRGRILADGAGPARFQHTPPKRPKVAERTKCCRAVVGASFVASTVS